MQLTLGMRQVAVQQFKYIKYTHTHTIYAHFNFNYSLTNHIVMDV